MSVGRRQQAGELAEIRDPQVGVNISVLRTEEAGEQPGAPACQHVDVAVADRHRLITNQAVAFDDRVECRRIGFPRIGVRRGDAAREEPGQAARSKQLGGPLRPTMRHDHVLPAGPADVLADLLHPGERRLVCWLRAFVVPSNRRLEQRLVEVVLLDQGRRAAPQRVPGEGDDPSQRGILPEIAERSPERARDCRVRVEQRAIHVPHDVAYRAYRAIGRPHWFNLRSGRRASRAGRRASQWGRPGC